MSFQISWLHIWPRITQLDVDAFNKIPRFGAILSDFLSPRTAAVGCNSSFKPTSLIWHTHTRVHTRTHTHKKNLLSSNSLCKWRQRQICNLLLEALSMWVMPWNKIKKTCRFHPTVLPDLFVFSLHNRHLAVLTCTVNKQSFPWTRNQAQIAKELKSNVEWDARSGGGGVGKKMEHSNPWRRTGRQAGWRREPGIIL